MAMRVIRCNLSLHLWGRGSIPSTNLIKGSAILSSNAGMIHVYHGHCYKQINHLNNSPIWVNLHVSVLLQSLMLWYLYFPLTAAFFTLMYFLPNCLGATSELELGQSHMSETKHRGNLLPAMWTPILWPQSSLQSQNVSKKLAWRRASHIPENVSKYSEGDDETLLMCWGQEHRSFQ